MDRAEVPGWQYIVNYIKYGVCHKGFFSSREILGWTLGFLLLHIYSKIQMRHKKRQDARKVGLYDFNEAQHDAPMIEVALLLHDKLHQALFKSESPTRIAASSCASSFINFFLSWDTVPAHDNKAKFEAAKI